MNTVTGHGPLREIRIEATVLGPCRYCGTGAEHWPKTPCAEGHQHDPTFTRPLGAVSRWHRNPLVRVWWRATDALRRRTR